MTARPASATARAFALQIDHARAARLRHRGGQFEVCYANSSQFEPS